ncbi:MAG TPA: M56 family peptidase [Armatimonadetes bacterium]|nr:M56 family peptidase [Armatimonadota bacterium]
MRFISAVIVIWMPTVAMLLMLAAIFTYLIEAMQLMPRTAIHRARLFGTALWLPITSAVIIAVVIVYSAMRCQGHGFAILQKPQQLHPCFQSGWHWCAHSSASHQWIAQLVMVVEEIILGMLVIIVALFAIVGRALWLRRWHQRQFLHPSVKLQRIIATLPADVQRALRFMECNSPSWMIATVGAFRPLCVLSTQLVNALNEDELRAVVRHELAHLQRRDHIMRWILRMLTGIFFMVPGFLWLRREWERATQQAADEATAMQPHQARIFGNALHKVEEMLTATTTNRNMQMVRHELRERRIRIMALADERVTASNAQHLMMSNWWTMFRRWGVPAAVQVALIAFIAMLAPVIARTAHCFAEVVVYSPFKLL